VATLRANALRECRERSVDVSDPGDGHGSATSSSPAPTFIEQARRRQIIASTIELISQQGYAGTSLAAIAAHAGISKAAVLYHFGSKAQLAEATLSDVFDRFAAHVWTRVERETDPTARLLAYVRAMIGYQREHRTHVRLITEVLLDDRGGTRMRQPGQHDRRGRWRALAELLRRGQQAGAFRSFDVRSVSLIIGGAIDNLVAHWLADPELDLDTATRELETFVLTAVEAR
jgi:TetR/AcrR family transcriptional regulator